MNCWNFLAKQRLLLILTICALQQQVTGVQEAPIAPFAREDSATREWEDGRSYTDIGAGLCLYGIPFAIMTVWSAVGDVKTGKTAPSFPTALLGSITVNAWCIGSCLLKKSGWSLLCKRPTGYNQLNDVV